MRIAAVALIGSLAAWVAVAIAVSVEGAPAPSPLEPRGARAERDREPQEPRSRPRPRRPKLPSAIGLRAAARFATGREGAVSFAVVNTDGRLRGREVRRRFAAASTVKAMLLAAELRRLAAAGDRLDPATENLLEAMITVSDNDAADAIHERVGDEGMFAVARDAGMADFTEAGHWGNAQVSAADLARLFANLDRLIPARFRAYGLGLLGSVAFSQSWGIPEAAGPGWAVRFKGGWLPERGLVHQAAELRDGERDLAIAVLTDAQPSFEYATETVRGVAARLLSRPGGGAPGA